MAASKNSRTATREMATHRARSGTVFYWIVAIIALVGLADATFLTIAHLTGDDAVCGSAAGCSEVLGSVYATVRGIPTAAFGAVAYFIVFSLAVLGVFGYAGVKKFLVALVAAMFLASLYFLYLQTFVLHAFCPYCLLSAALSFFLAGLLIAVPAAG